MNPIFSNGNSAMPVEIKFFLSRNTAKLFSMIGSVFVISLMVFAPTAKAIEVLSAQELASHCALLDSEPDGVDGQYCIRYIQGFIDGAIATDVRVMLNAESALTETKSETFTERAMRTRLPTRADRFRAASLAGFCLGDPLELRSVVDVVVADLAALPESKAQTEPAMEVVYESLQQHYPCNS
ncbi:MAG: hypothetical protein ACJAUG_002415 [Halioglobus sp.]|jgi:hypothetical protein